MRAIALKKFRDKHTKRVYKAGDEFVCNKARFAELCEKLPGFAKDADDGNAKDGDK